MDDIEIKKLLREASGLTLAYLGDSVWELFVRKFYVERSLNNKNLNRRVKAMVNARKQSSMYREILPGLDPEYKAYAKRGKNANIKSWPRSCSPLEYREATGFEALIGGLYMNRNIPMIEEIIKKYAEEES
ncbi:MAG: Mini-ribonuclease 3-like protein [Fusobacteriaceae bacterium]|jgi:ribonuclease-3 family protein|nr:Mini-ribonuclease 3-like protein [Fusobacteriaceae bacterium]